MAQLRPVTPADPELLERSLDEATAELDEATAELAETRDQDDGAPPPSAAAVSPEPAAVPDAYRRSMRRVTDTALLGIAVIVGTFASRDIGAALADGTDDASEELAGLLCEWTQGAGSKLVKFGAVACAFGRKALMRAAAGLNDPVSPVAPA